MSLSELRNRILDRVPDQTNIHIGNEVIQSAKRASDVYAVAREYMATNTPAIKALRDLMDKKVLRILNQSDSDNNAK